MNTTNHPWGFVIVLAVMLALAFGLGVYQANVQQQGPGDLPGVTLFEHSTAVDDFSFVDQHGKSISQSDFKPGWRLVFFGYTYCPDICPTTLADLSRAWKALSPEAQTINQVVFVSIDPERDTPESLAPYLNYFNPAFMAMTGNPVDLQRLAEQINGFYARVDRGEGQAYLMDHSANLMLVDADWQYRGYVEPPFTRDTMVTLLEALAQRTLERQ